MGLKEYKAKRKFGKTPEPKGKVKEGKGLLRFVVQKHHASHLHYDFRLEMDGVLKSWAVPKGPSLNSADKRLAMMVEDHPIEYGKFEGIIPPGNYGAGTVMVWDEGTFQAPGIEEREEGEKILLKGLKDGNLKFVLSGKKLKGEFALVRLKTGKGNEWLLIKKNDKYAKEEDVTKKDKSVVSKRTLEQIKKESGEGDTVWHSHRMSVSMELVKKGRKAAMPHEVKPMMATLVKESFDSEDWIFEIKWDGYRAIAEVNYNEVSLYSRNNLPFNKDFPSVVKSLSTLGTKVVLDGEICVVDEEGKASFQLIQNYKRTGKGNVIYYVFDILYYEGYDVTELPLVERKELVKQVVSNIPSIKFSDHIEKKGMQFFELIKQQKMEGVMAKKSNSAYYEGIRGKEWLKIKVQHEQEAVIAGFTEPRGGRKKFGSLVLGVYEGDELVYIGHTGGGFNEQTLQEIHTTLKSLETEKCPFKKIPKTNMPVTWVKPERVCVVKFQEWTDDGIMRQPIFLGIREDKMAKEVTREIEKSTTKIVKDEKERNLKTKVKAKSTGGESKAKNKKNNRSESGRTGVQVKNRKPVNRSGVPGKEKKKSEGKKVKSVTGSLDSESNLIGKNSLDAKENEAQVKVDGNSLQLSNLKKIFWQEEGYTKRDLIEYYDRIAPYLLPYLKDRPESLRRNPNGYKQASFFQKDMPSTLPDWIETVKVYSESNDKEINYMLCQDKASLLYMANLGCIEINPWLSRVQNLDYPDFIAIDLDPLDVPFEQVIEVTHAVKEVLDKGDIKGFCKTSGSRGMHIYIPMQAKYMYDQAKQFAQLIASLTHELVPSITSLERMPAKRKNKIYLDYLQNRKGQTLAAPYCLRPKPGATVSTPLEWEEVKQGLHPSQFTIQTIFKRLEEKGDVFKGVMGKGTDIEKAMKRLSKS